MSTNIVPTGTQPSDDRYLEFDVAVHGGSLHCGSWGSGEPTVLALHGITATHIGWLGVAAQAPDLHLLAPDLRGRGRSRDLPGPYGFAAHVADLVSVLDSASAERVVVVGHSMGAFVATALAAHHPDRVAGLVLVDGGLPLGRPEDPVAPGGIEAVLGPAAARLEMTFPSRDSYRDFWRSHPAMGPIWGPVVQAYADYDLVGQPPELHASCRPEAMFTDGAEVGDHASAAEMLRQVTVPTTFLRAERGMLDEPQPLFSAAAAERWLQEFPAINASTIPDTNHYSIVLGTPGSKAVATAVVEMVGA